MVGCKLTNIARSTAIYLHEQDPEQFIYTSKNTCTNAE